MKKRKKSKEEDFNPYCTVCGGCGYVMCDGVAAFLLRHVKGKTNCKHEAQFIQEIIEYISKN